ncbi:MAG: hypothetical protein J0H15_05420 [Xanthomonadales bacterium]|nr:hypothetical protein [Xanthomonadales bacterium]
MLAAASAAVASAPRVQPLAAGDVPALLQPPAHGERIIALWALDCVYCEPNLRALAALQAAHPETVELVTVATDGMSEQARIQARLQAIGMQAYAAWAYIEVTPDRLNFLVDPDWGGETPRTLVIRADGTRMALSGRLTPEQLRRIAPGGR